jgi:hypothetical protein
MKLGRFDVVSPPPLKPVLSLLITPYFSKILSVHNVREAVL